jgi:beta-glucosidase
MDWRIDTSVKGPVTLSVGGGSLNLQSVIATATLGTRLQTRIPLRCFADAGAKFAAVGSPIRMQAPKGLVATIRTVHIEETKESVTCPGKAR